MASEIQICNLALSRVGAGRIESLNDPTKEARACKLLLPFARDAALEAHDWSFARKRKVLALLSTKYSGWDYAYSFPADCVAPRKIFTELATPVEFETAVDDALASNVILTNEADAELIYTAKVSNTNIWSALFSDAVAWRLGADLAYTLLRKESLQQKMLAFFSGTVGSAAASNANSDNKQPKTTNPFVEAR